MNDQAPIIQLVPIAFEEREVRVIQGKDGEPRFVAKDVAQALGYRWQSALIKHVPDEWRGINSVQTPSGVQPLSVLTEQGLYFFLARSDKPCATKLLSEVFERAGSAMEIVKALQSFEMPDDLPDMYVYAIREIETGRVKLGISRDPQRRLTTLQTGNSRTLELVAYRKAENRFYEEVSVHRLNESIRIRGEWFEPSASLDGPPL